MTYTVVANDTLIGIATRFGISLDALLAANPGVDPQFLAVGTVLRIPAPQSTPQPTAVAAAEVQVDTPACWPVRDGAWCLAVVRNAGDSSVEQVLVRLVVRAPEGDIQAEQQASALLNRLPAGERLVVGAFFAGLHLVEGQAQAELSNALPVNEEAARYLDASVTYRWEAEASGLALVQGTVVAPRETRLLWLLGMAFDGEGRPVAFRRLELAPTGEATTFQMRLYALQGEIADVHLLVEARP